MFLQLKGLKKIYEEEKGLKNLDLEIEEGSFVTLLGPSGCGKPDSGHILLEGEDITGLPPERRPVSTVFQSYALFPHLNVLDNVCYGLRFFRGMKKKEAAPIAMEELKTVGLSGYETARIGELSGGQQQRVALARAMAKDPSAGRAPFQSGRRAPGAAERGAEGAPEKAGHHHGLRDP